MCECNRCILLIDVGILGTRRYAKVREGRWKYANKFLAREGVHKRYILGYKPFCDILEDEKALFVSLMKLYVMEDVS